MRFRLENHASTHEETKWAIEDTRDGEWHFIAYYNPWYGEEMARRTKERLERERPERAPYRLVRRKVTTVKVYEFDYPDDSDE